MKYYLRQGGGHPQEMEISITLFQALRHLLNKELMAEKWDEGGLEYSNSDWGFYLTAKEAK